MIMGDSQYRMLLVTCSPGRGYAAQRSPLQRLLHFASDESTPVNVANHRSRCVISGKEKERET